MTIETLTVKQDQMTLDLLLWRRLGVEFPGLVERTLAANVGLAGLGHFLPVGTAVVVDIPVVEASAVKTVVRLFD